jgi:hypothetical protein
MGRHAATSAGRRSAQLTPQVLIAVAVAAVVLLAGGLTMWAVNAGDGECESTAVVRVAVAPELAPVAEQVLGDAEGLRPEDCAAAEVTAQQPVQTVGDLGALDAADLPHVWVPDSSLWTARAEGADLESAGSVASSPVVLATSEAAVDELGWADEAPGWAEALAGPQGIAVPDLAASAEALAALSAVRTSLGGGEDADNAVVQTVLAAERGPSVSPADALAAGSEGDADAPLVPVSEQEVWAANADAEDPQLVAVYPEEGSPVLDYPLVRVGTASATDAAAVDAAVRALTSDAARSAVLEAGFPRHRRHRAGRCRGGRDLRGRPGGAAARPRPGAGAARPAVRAGRAVPDPHRLRRLDLHGGAAGDGPARRSPGTPPRARSRWCRATSPWGCGSSPPSWTTNGTGPRRCPPGSSRRRSRAPCSASCSTSSSTPSPSG